MNLFRLGHADKFYLITLRLEMSDCEEFRTVARYISRIDKYYRDRYKSDIFQKEFSS